MARALERSCKAFAKLSQSFRKALKGRDDPETAAEMILRADDSIRVPSVPVRLLRELASSLSMQDIAEPEGLPQGQPEGLPEGQTEGF